MKFLIPFPLLTFLLWASLLHAADLAQGHHLWRVQAPNGSQSFIAAVSNDSSAPVMDILKKQLQATRATERILLSSRGWVDNVAVPESWRALAKAALPQDLLKAIKVELAPHLEELGFSIESVDEAPLETLRLVLIGRLKPAGSPRTDPAVEALHQKLIIQEGQSKKHEMLSIRSYYSKKWGAGVPEFRLKAPTDPVAVLRYLLADRIEHGHLMTRAEEAYLRGDWETLARLQSIKSIALAGVSDNAFPYLFRSGSEIVAFAAPALSEMPTLFMLYQTNFLSGDQGILSQFQRLGFTIQPVSIKGLDL
ncbi:MAG TPA: hypothetical protein VEZ24_12220 [Microvirga sp.]|nr:hypothetical protein [Microvirga sp.]